jgi:glucose-6-phosphate-specific signal transduction histidine kinase
VVRFLRAHLDSVIAVLLAGAFLIEAYLADSPIAGEPLVADLAVDEIVPVAASVVFLLSLALRSQMPLVPLVLGGAMLALNGRAQDEPLYSLFAGLVLAAYSVGAWAGGRTGQVGALGVGTLVGLVVLRSFEGSLDADVHAVPAITLVGAWLIGLAVRSIRAARGDERVVGELDWESGTATPDSAGRDEIVRELRDIIERAMSAVVLQSRNARRSLDNDPAAAHRALVVVETAGTDALEETQRLTGLLLSPDGTPLPEPQPGLADLDYLAEQVIAAGLPVDMRIEGRPLPLTPDLDAVAYRVVHEALMATLDQAPGAHSSVVVRYEPDELHIEVVDDAIGGGEDAAAETAGLVEARDAVVRLGGTLDAGPGEERGYWVLARLPYEPDWA